MTDAEQRAAAVMRRIDRLAQRLSDNLAVGAYLRAQLRKTNSEAMRLHGQIQELHELRHAIYHEDDE